MLACKTCGKENHDHYRYCLGCGSEIEVPGGAQFKAAPSSLGYDKTVDPMTANPLAGANLDDLDATDPKAMAVPPSALPSAGEARLCPSCGSLVHEASFCGQCGTRVTPSAAKPPARTLFLGDKPLATPALRGKLVLIRPDGSEGGTHSLTEGENIIGRGTGALFDADNYLSPHHAELVLNGAGMVVRDADSLNGVFVKLTDEEEIDDHDVFRIGQELLRFDVIRAPVPLDDGTEVMGSPNPGYWGRIALIIGKEQDGSAFPLFGDAVILGRERGDILFPEDGYVSGTHARLAIREDRFFLADMNSSNGTFLRIHQERAVRSGTFLLMGQQLFRVQFS